MRSSTDEDGVGGALRGIRQRRSGLWDISQASPMGLLSSL